MSTLKPLIWATLLISAAFGSHTQAASDPTAGSDLGVPRVTDRTPNSASMDSQTTARMDTTTGTIERMDTNRMGIPTWSTEDRFWRETYSSRPYYRSGTGYETYRPAYEYGFNSFERFNGRRFEDIDQSELRTGWERSRGSSTLSWDEAQNATRDAYSRLQNNRIGTPPGSRATEGGGSSATVR